MMNQQKNDIFEGGYKLPVIDEFYTLQGEGYHTGKPAYFLRIGGCDIGCSWCDTKFSWRPDLDHLVHVDKILKNALQYPARAIVITGGEPLIYNLNPLCDLLKIHGFKTFIETSGSHPMSGIWDWICLSPKKQNSPEDSIFKSAHELKVIIYEHSDFEWAEHCAKKVSPDCKLYLQPEWSRYKKNIKAIVEYIKINPTWDLSLQIHKLIGIP